jgi:rhamnosyltransferase
MRRYPVRFWRIAAEDFGHGRTRNFLAGEARGAVLVLLSQDAEPASTEWLAALVAPLAEPTVAGVYGRQIPRADTDPLMRFTLAELYGPTPAVRSLRPGARARFDEVFFSNVNSAIRRDVWQRIPFREDVVMSEDAYWARDAMRAGYAVAYEPRARVYHAHRYSLRGAFHRHRLSGASLRGLIADTPASISLRGLTYLAREAAFLARHGHLAWLPYMLVYEAAKATGFALGISSRGMGRARRAGPAAARHAERPARG